VSGRASTDSAEAQFERHRVRPRSRIVALVGVVALGGCSLPVDQRTTALEQGAFPDELTEATTTTTVAPPTPTTVAQPEPPPLVDTTTTTLPPIPVEPVTVYFARGLTDVMQAVEIARPIGTPVLELVSLLERPSGITEAGLRTTVLPGLIDDIVVDRGTATIVLDQAVLDRMSNTNQQRAIAQIVLTVTSFRTIDAGAIGRVRFEVDRSGFPVFVPAFGGSSDPGEELAFTDFQSLIATTPTPATTQPATTQPEPTQPEPTQPDTTQPEPTPSDDSSPTTDGGSADEAV
jgi:hypothetical protein